VDLSSGVGRTAAVEFDAARLAESPIAAHISVPATIHPHFLFHGIRRSVLDGSELAFTSARPGWRSRFGTGLFMMVVLGFY
jgi:hypothetical protein